MCSGADESSDQDYDSAHQALHIFPKYSVSSRISVQDVINGRA